MKKLMMCLMCLTLLSLSGCALFTPKPPTVKITFTHPELGDMTYERSGEQEIQGFEIRSDPVDVSLEGQQVKDTATSKAMDAINTLLKRDEAGEVINRVTEQVIK